VERPYFRLYECNYPVDDCIWIQQFTKILVQIVFSYKRLQDIFLTPNSLKYSDLAVIVSKFIYKP